MKRLSTLLMICGLAIPADVAAQTNQGDPLIPSQLELSEPQQKDLKKLLDKQLTDTVKTCVGKYPRPEFFTTLSVEFKLRKSGDLRGSYVPAGVVDSNMYVTSDEERTKLEADGAFARTVVRNDREMERCFQKATRQLDSGIGRVAATVAVAYTITWKGKIPSLQSTEFLVTN